ncbi:LacI family DNA-binding transcriptional regulator [Acetonema longum]|uniref:Transcriptional regulator, LacI family protein n=1 Tax=Acetonema longum DSM 6540 TaxID=1009370 RepID=F7NMA4_9FIRM|nr:LacI family DNA-binding transcriptional regulator [Acetonema longum]EGO62842.1 transcriptional regulator, LacI family protein [Acetonema longum DSM 6540]
MQRKDLKRLTIKDVARTAGVSIATVSRILNGQGGVSEELIDKVQLTVQELNYQPNAVARALKVQESRSIGLIIPDIGNPFFPALVRGVEDAAQVHGYALILCNTDGDPDKEINYIKFLRSKQVDGILLVGNIGFEQSGHWLSDAAVPIVLVDRRIAGAPLSTVIVDNQAGAVLAVEHLIRQGRRQIAIVSGRPASPTNTERVNGYIQALAANRLFCRTDLVVNGDFTFEGGYRAAEILLNRGCRFDAIFAANDLMAIGVIECLAQNGRRVPDDVAVAGFDNIRLAAWYKPALTTINQPVYEMGQLAVAALLEHMADSGAQARDIMLKPELIIRQSSGGKEQS